MQQDSITIKLTDVLDDPILDAFVQYLTIKGISAPPIAEQRPQPRQPATGSDHLIRLVQLLSDGLSQTHSVASQRSASLTEALTQFRSETDVTDVYKGRIVDLQKVINGTKLPGELDALIGRQEVVVPTGADITNTQRQRETVHEVSRLAGRVSDSNERLRAQNALLSTQVAGLLAENALLMDRITLLEDQVSALGNSAAVTMRALNKSRQAGAAATASTSTLLASNSSRPLKSNETLLSGVAMDRETVLWLKEVHAQLLSGKEVEEAIRVVGRDTASGRPRLSASRREDSSVHRATTPFAMHVEASRASAIGPIDKDDAADDSSVY